MKNLSVKKLATVVSQRRKSKNLTQVQLADATGIHRSMIGRLENMDYVPSIQQLETLGEFLGFEVVDLFEEDEPFVIKAPVLDR